MTTQRLHSTLAPIDVLTREELEQSLTANFDRELRERFRGLDIVRVPEAPIPGNGGTLNMTTGNDSTPWGPEQGDIWGLRRVVVKSSALADTAKYILFRGSTPSDAANAFTARFLLEGFAAGAAGQPVGMGFYPGSEAIFLQPGEQIYAQVLGSLAANQYTLNAEAIRCPAEMKGKLL